jgi:hypothetical protein
MRWVRTVLFRMFSADGRKQRRVIALETCELSKPKLVEEEFEF